MKNLASLLNRTVLAVAGALALGACSRGQYAVLPKAPAYLGSAPIVAAAPRPAAPATIAPEAASQEAAAPKATLPTAAVDAENLAATPVTAARLVTTASASKPAKLNLVQRLAVKQLTKKLDKIASKAPQLKKHDATASTNRLDGKLRQAIIIGVIGVLIELLGAAIGSSFVYVIGAIFIIVALVLLLLYLLDQV